MGFGGPGAMGFSGGGLFLIILIIWSVAIKGFALWHAARRGEKWWFVALLIINTAGILELIYLIFFAKVLLRDRMKNAPSLESDPAPKHSHSSDSSHHSDHSHGSYAPKPTEDTKDGN